MVTLQQHLARVRDCKLQLGIRDTPAEVEAMRTKGGRRTSGKRVLLYRTAARARGAGVEPVPAYY